MLFAGFSFLCLAAASLASPVADSLLAEPDPPDQSNGLEERGGASAAGLKVRVSPQTYDRIDLYTKYAAFGVAKSKKCVLAPGTSKVVRFISTKKTDSQATIFEDTPSKEYIIAFPGTHSAEDAQLDKKDQLTPIDTAGVSTHKCHGCKVHTGFQMAWNAMVPPIQKFLDAGLAKNKDFKVVIVGHSLGGGIASIATASLRGQGYPVKSTYTFGQPRTGNQQYADYIDQICGASELIGGDFYRVTHANDGVPQWPGTKKGYVHHRTEIWQVDNAAGNQDARHTFRCFGQEPKDCNLGTKSPHTVDAAHGIYSNINFGGRLQGCPGAH